MFLTVQLAIIENDIQFYGSNWHFGPAETN